LHKKLNNNALKIFLFTAVIGAPLVLIIKKAPIMAFFYGLSSSKLLILSLTGNIFGVGILEECCKAIPVIYLLWGQKLERKEFFLSGTVSGISFALFEFLYRANNSDNIPLLFLVLFITHGLLSGISLFISGRKGVISVKNSILGVFIASILHGIFNSL